MSENFKKIIENYDQLEKKEILNTPFQFKKVFSPITHYKLSDPTRLSSVDEIAFFFDVFHDQRASVTVNQLMNGLNNKYLFFEGTGHNEFLSFEKVKKILSEYNYDIFYEKNDVYLFKYKKNYKSKKFFLRKFRNYPFIRLIFNEICFLFKKLNEKIKHRNKSIFCKNQFYIKDINNFFMIRFTKILKFVLHRWNFLN